MIRLIVPRLTSAHGKPQCWRGYNVTPEAAVVMSLCNIVACHFLVSHRGHCVCSLAQRTVTLIKNEDEIGARSTVVERGTAMRVSADSNPAQTEEVLVLVRS